MNRNALVLLLVLLILVVALPVGYWGGPVWGGGVGLVLVVVIFVLILSNWPPLAVLLISLPLVGGCTYFTAEKPGEFKVSGGTFLQDLNVGNLEYETHGPGPTSRRAKITDGTTNQKLGEALKALGDAIK